MFTVLSQKKPKKMSVKFDSTEHVLSNLGDGFVTDYKEKHYVIHAAHLGEMRLYDLLPLAYSGSAAVFGEPDTACKGYAFAIEDYFSSIFRARILMIKEGEEGLDGVIDDGWQELMEWRERPMALGHATVRPPVNFQVNLRSIKNAVMDGTWPQARFAANQPEGQFCALLFPPERMERGLWSVFNRARELLKAYQPDTFMEEDGCCWNSTYRAGGEWCPPIEVAEGNFFFNYVKKELNKEKDQAKRGVRKPARVAPVKVAPTLVEEPAEEEAVDSEDEFADAREDPPAPQEEARAETAADPEEAEANIEPQRTGARPKTPAPARAPLAKARNPQFTVGADYAPGADPINRTLEGLGYAGAEKRNFYKMVRNGQIPLEAIQPKQEKAKKNKDAGQPQGGRAPPSRGASSGPAQPAPPQGGCYGYGPEKTEKAAEYPAPRGEPVRFANFEGTRKINALCRKGEFDRVEQALKSPRNDWTVNLKVNIRSKVETINKYLVKHPEGAFQSILDLVRRECKSEKSYLKVLGVLYGLMELDVEDNTYSARTTKDPLYSDEE